MHKNSYKSRLYELISASQGAKAVVGAFKKVGRQYDKTHLVGWWVGLYSRRGLPLRGRGAYGPVLTHGPRVVAADAAGAEALVGVLKIIKDASYNKTREPPWRAMEKRPPLVAAPPPLPKGKRVTGFSVAQRLPRNPVPLPPQLRWGHYGCSALHHMTLQEGVEKPILPPE